MMADSLLTDDCNDSPGRVSSNQPMHEEYLTIFDPDRKTKGLGIFLTVGKPEKAERDLSAFSDLIVLELDTA
jgi:hypothetical protein